MVAFDVQAQQKRRQRLRKSGISAHSPQVSINDTTASGSGFLKQRRLLRRQQSNSSHHPLQPRQRSGKCPVSSRRLQAEAHRAMNSSEICAQGNEFFRSLFLPAVGFSSRRRLPWRRQSKSNRAAILYSDGKTKKGLATIDTLYSHCLLGREVFLSLLICCDQSPACPADGVYCCVDKANRTVTLHDSAPLRRRVSSQLFSSPTAPRDENFYNLPLLSVASTS